MPIILFDIHVVAAFVVVSLLSPLFSIAQYYRFDYRIIINVVPVGGIVAI